MVGFLPNNLCIIPARGGSKGVPKKNVVNVAGKPLIVHSIEHALSARSITRIVVSTDDREISRISQAAGVEVIDRPDELCSDQASSESALSHALNHLKESENYHPDTVVFLQATSPLRKPDDIDNAMSLFISSRADSLFSARRIEGFVWYAETERLTPINYEPVSRPRRQELEQHVLEENGSIYIFRPQVLEQHGCRLGGKIVAYEMSCFYSLQVDRPEDIDLINRVFELEYRPG